MPLIIDAPTVDPLFAGNRQRTPARSQFRTSNPGEMMASQYEDADDIVAAAGTNTLQIADSEIFADIVLHLQLIGKKVAALVPDGERVSLFIPVFVKLDGKSRPGGLMYTDTQVIVGYTEGAMRLSTSYARAIPLAAITASPTSRQKIGAFSPKSPSITIHSADFTFDAIFNATGTNKKLFSAAVSILRGFATVILDADGNFQRLEIDAEAPSFAQFSTEATVI